MNGSESSGINWFRGAAITGHGSGSSERNVITIPGRRMRDGADDYVFADEHDESQSDDEQDGDRITLDEIDENLANLGLNFHSGRGDANASPVREVPEREGENAMRYNVGDAHTSDMVWFSADLIEENWTESPNRIQSQSRRDNTQASPTLTTRRVRPTIRYGFLLIYLSKTKTSII